jgi:hypothetical protein
MIFFFIQQKHCFLYNIIYLKNNIYYIFINPSLKITITFYYYLRRNTNNKIII